MDFDIPDQLDAYLNELDRFIEDEIKPLENENDNIRFFDHRREDARTDWERGGLPTEDWEALLFEARTRADRAGHYRFAMPKELGGKDGGNLAMAVIREHLATKGLGLHNDLQNEHSIVGNNVGVLLMTEYGSAEQKEEWLPLMLEGKRGFAFGITEPAHGSDATHMETHAVRDGDGWKINGAKTWNTGIHKAQYDMVMARTSGKAGDGDGIGAETRAVVGGNTGAVITLQLFFQGQFRTDQGIINMGFEPGNQLHEATWEGKGTDLEMAKYIKKKGAGPHTLTAFESLRLVLEGRGHATARQAAASALRELFKRDSERKSGTQLFWRKPERDSAPRIQFF